LRFGDIALNYKRNFGNGIFIRKISPYFLRKPAKGADKVGIAQIAIVFSAMCRTGGMNSGNDALSGKAGAPFRS
jgi:hypothetical protein